MAKFAKIAKKAASGLLGYPGSPIRGGEGFWRCTPFSFPLPASAVALSFFASTAAVTATARASALHD